MAKRLKEISDFEKISSGFIRPYRRGIE